MADFTRITRQGLDIARRQLKLPAAIVLLKRVQSGANTGKYGDLLTVTGGWLVYHMTEVVGGETSRFVNLIITDDREDLNEAVMQQVAGARYTARGRTFLFSKKHVRPTIFGDPAYYQIGLDPTKEKTP